MSQSERNVEFSSDDSDANSDLSLAFTNTEVSDDNQEEFDVDQDILNLSKVDSLEQSSKSLAKQQQTEKSEKQLENEIEEDVLDDDSDMEANLMENGGNKVEDYDSFGKKLKENLIRKRNINRKERRYLTKKKIKKTNKMKMKELKELKTKMKKVKELKKMMKIMKIMKKVYERKLNLIKMLQ